MWSAVGIRGRTPHNKQDAGAYVREGGEPAAVVGAGDGRGRRQLHVRALLARTQVSLGAD